MRTPKIALIALGAAALCVATAASAENVSGYEAKGSAYEKKGLAHEEMGQTGADTIGVMGKIMFVDYTTKAGKECVAFFNSGYGPAYCILDNEAAGRLKNDIGAEGGYVRIKGDISEEGGAKHFEISEHEVLSNRKAPAYKKEAGSDKGSGREREESY